MNIGPELDTKIANLEPEAQEIALRMLEALLFKYVEGPRELAKANETLNLQIEAFDEVGTESADKAYAAAQLRQQVKRQKALEEPLGFAHVARSESKRRRGRSELSNSWGKRKK